MKRIAIFLVLALSACGLYFADTPRHGKGGNGSGTGPDAAVIGDAFVDDAANCNGINCPDAGYGSDGGSCGNGGICPDAYLPPDCHL